MFYLYFVPSEIYLEQTIHSLENSTSLIFKPGILSDKFQESALAITKSILAIVHPDSDCHWNFLFYQYAHNPFEIHSSPKNIWFHQD